MLREELPMKFVLEIGDQSREPESPTENAHPDQADKLAAILELLAQHGLGVADVTQPNPHGTPPPNRWFALRSLDDKTVTKWVPAD